mgnify:CR=1 FL=1
MRKLKLPGRNSNGPKLGDEDIQIIKETGVDGIKKQARKIVETKLRDQPENDGRQTPSAGNPVYKAMHACSAASRKELSKAHRVPAGGEMTENQVKAVVNLLVRWIVREYNFYLEEKREQQKNLGEFA